MPGQTEEQSDQGLHCLPRLIRVYTFCHSVCSVWTHYSMVEPHSSNFRVTTTNFLGVRIFRKSKKISNDQELIQSDPISCPQNQKGNN